MTTTYADISLINTTYNATHTFDDDVAGAGLVESLSVSPNYGGGLTELMTGGSSRENGFPSSTSVSIAGVISGDGGSNKASTTIKKIGQILHDGKLKIRFGQDDLELTDCVILMHQPSQSSQSLGLAPPLLIPASLLGQSIVVRQPLLSSGLYLLGWE